jgi:hypothetical protein
MAIPVVHDHRADAMARTDVKLEAREQRSPPGWVIFAVHINGREMQLAGLFTSQKFALDWISYQGPSLLPYFTTLLQ